MVCVCCWSVCVYMYLCVYVSERERGCGVYGCGAHVGHSVGLFCLVVFVFVFVQTFALICVPVGVMHLSLVVHTSIPAQVQPQNASYAQLHSIGHYAHLMHAS